MTIASEITRLQGIKSEIMAALERKNVDTTGKNISNVGDLIRSIEAGPKTVRIGEHDYPYVMIGNQLWLARNLDEELGTIGLNEWYYNGRSNATYINAENSIRKALSTPYQATYVYDWNDGHTSSNNLAYKSNIPGKYIRVHFVATMNKAQLAPVTISTRFAAWDEDYTSIGAYSRNVIGTIPAGETTETFDLSFEASDLNLEGIARFDFITTTSGTGIDGTTIIDFTDIKVFASTEPYTSTPTSTITVPEALANEEAAKANNYGRLYIWNNVNTNLSKLGLTKWRWPTKADFDGLVALDPTGEKFRAKTFASGTDDFGLCIIESGIYAPDYGGFSRGSWNAWTSNSRTRANITTRDFKTNTTDIQRGLSLRLVLDL